MGDSLPHDQPETSRAPVDIRTVSLAILAGIALLVLMRFARNVLIPLAAGVLFSYALAPIVTRLEKWRIPRAVGAAVLLIGIVVGGSFGAYALVDDTVAVVEKLPAATRRLGELVRRSTGGEEGLLQKVQEAATEVENTAEAVGPEPVQEGVTRVQIEEKPIDVRDYLLRGGTKVSDLVSDVILVLFLVYFILITGDLFKRKILKIVGPSAARKKVAAEILDEIDAQVGRYMLIQLLTSVFVGVTTGVAFRLLGLEQAPIWGIVVGILDMIPYFGPVIATVGLFTIGFLQFGTITMGASLAGLCAVIMGLEGWVLTPSLTMRAMHMNGVALFVGLMFWGWMWGIWGMLLAVPMMVMTKAISDRIEGLHPIGELLGD